MARYQTTVGGNTVQGLLTRHAGLAKLVEQVVNQVLEAQSTEQLKAARYERTENRRGHRNGHRDTPMTTPTGRLVPVTATSIWKTPGAGEPAPTDEDAVGMSDSEEHAA